MSKVHLVPLDRDAPSDEIDEKVESLWRGADLASCIKPKDLVAIKLHVGEPGRPTFVSPAIVTALVRLVKEAGGRPFLTDTAVLYRSPRDNGVGHALVAAEHGFGLETVGAPFVPADGVTGADGIEVQVDGKHFERVDIASAIAHADSILILSHATGHLGTGFGGTLKNLGMGCSTRKAKLQQHHGQHPNIDPIVCDACGTCVDWCPADAIEVNEHAVIDEGTCIGCGECVAACREGAVRFGWAIMGRELQERIVEHAAGVARGKPGRIGYVTVATNITKDCDCLGIEQEPLLDDIGILASLDPVALDQAVHDLVRERAGRTLEDLSYPDRDGTVQMTYAETLGLGSCSVDLVTDHANG
jgi:uncharacterized protein